MFSKYIKVDKFLKTKVYSLCFFGLAGVILSLPAYAIPMALLVVLCPLSVVGRLCHL